jgi:hypothetical protein
MGRPQKNIGESSEHLAMQLSTAIARVDMLARRLNLGSHPHALAAEIQAKLREYCSIVAPPDVEQQSCAPVIYQANPIRLVAARVTGLGGQDANGSRSVKLDDGRTIIAIKHMQGAVYLRVGDYHITPDEGISYFMPAEEFRRKFSPAQAEAA